VKIASVRIGDRDVVAVQVTEDSVIEVGNLLDLAGDESIATPGTMQEMIVAGDALLFHLETAGRSASEDTLNLRAMTPDAWYPPVRCPGKILGVAMNNSASNERKISAPDHPAFFLKPSSCLIGHREPIRIRPYYGSVHPEPELAAARCGSSSGCKTSAITIVFGSSACWVRLLVELAGFAALVASSSISMDSGPGSRPAAGAGSKIGAITSTCCSVSGPPPPNRNATAAASAAPTASTPPTIMERVMACFFVGAIAAMICECKPRGVSGICRTETSR
jgi:hypothetical protein